MRFVCMGEEDDDEGAAPVDLIGFELSSTSKARASGRTTEDCRKIGDEIGAEILHNYDDILKSCNALDYLDLISCSLKLLTEFLTVLNECQESRKAIIIDEFQDTSPMQYSLLGILASHNHITVVGDEDQVAQRGIVYLFATSVEIESSNSFFNIAGGMYFLAVFSGRWKCESYQLNQSFAS